MPATISWLAAFTVWPEPGGPTSTTVEPTASRIGFTSSKSARSAPTMIERVASTAPGSPPLTGASSTRMPAALPGLGEPDGDIGPDGGHVDVDRALRRVGVDAVVAERNAFHIGRVRDHGDDHFGLADRLGDAGRRRCRRPRRASPRDRMTRLTPITVWPASTRWPRHRAAHDAETDEGDGAHSRLHFSWRSQRRLSIVVVVGMYSSET